MNLRTVAAAVLAGLAAFLVVGVSVTELAADRIAFSVFLGIPAGLVAGVAAAVLVLLGFDSDLPRRRRAAIALVAFGGTFAVVLLVAVLGFGQGAVVSMTVATVVGAVAWVVAFLRSGTGEDTEGSDGEDAYGG